MKQQLLNACLVVALTFIVVGCRSTNTPAKPTEVPANGFVLDWPAPLKLQKDPIRSIYLRGNSLIAYTASNRGYWLTADSGQVLSTSKISEVGHTLLPPVVLADGMVIPTTTSLETFDKIGRHLHSYPTPSAIQSPAASTGNAFFLAVSNPNGGRLARYDLKQTLVQTWELYTGRGVTAAPVVYSDTVYAGGVDGQVWAITTDRQPIWAIPDSTFKTNGKISADLSADAFGVYVASEDQKLYCLDRMSGKIKWIFFATAPLIDQPIVIGDFVYQQVPGKGLVALKKSEGSYSREPLWIQPMANQILSADEQNVYVRSGRGTIVALDKATGKPKFQSSRKDLTVFATNLTTPIIYAATRGGDLLAIRPVLKPGTVGLMVWNRQILREPIAMAN